MRSFVSRTRGHLIVYATFVVINYVCKAAESETYCLGRSMGLHCDHTMFKPIVPPNKLEWVKFANSGIRTAKCGWKELHKNNTPQWMVSCGQPTNTTFRISLFVLKATRSDNGKYTCLLKTNSQPKVETVELAEVTITDSCIGHAFYLPGYTRGPELLSEYVIPEPSDPWPKPYPLMKSIVESYGVLMGAIACIAFLINCTPQCLCKRIMGSYEDEKNAGSSEGGSYEDGKDAGSSEGESASNGTDSDPSLPMEVYGGGSNVIAIVDDTYMQDDYQSPTGSFMIIPHTLKINPELSDYHHL